MNILQQAITLLILLQFKHLVIDWYWQPKYEWANKGTYGHFGGIRHALKNAAGTAICFLVYVSFSTAIMVFLIDGLLHYHIDWSKMNINRVKNWQPTSHPQFWWLTGFDQFLHQTVYLLLILYFIH